MLPFELTKDTPYLALSGELWSVFYEYFNRNWSCYKGFLLYVWMFVEPVLRVWTTRYPVGSQSLSQYGAPFNMGTMQLSLVSM